jgi:hypothetical protein
MDHEDYLTGLVEATVQQWGYAWTLTGPDELELVDAHGRRLLLALHTLRRRVRDRPRDQWPALAADYVSTSLTVIETHVADPVDLRDFATAAMLLRTRLYTTRFEDLDHYLVRPVAPGLAQMVVVDYPIAVCLPPREITAQWPAADDALFTLAQDNTRGDGPLEVEWHTATGAPVAADDPDACIATLVGSDEYASCHTLWLDQYPVLGPAGALFVVPAEGVVHAHPLTECAAALHAIMRLAVLADEHYRHREHRISPCVYLWRRGDIRLAATTSVQDNSMTVHYSDEFLDILDQLRA